MPQKNEGYVVIPSTAKPASVHPTLPDALERVARDVGGLTKEGKDIGRKCLEGGGLTRRTTIPGNDGKADVLPAEMP